MRGLALRARIADLEAVIQNLRWHYRRRVGKAERSAEVMLRAAAELTRLGATDLAKDVRASAFDLRDRRRHRGNGKSCRPVGHNQELPHIVLGLMDPHAERAKDLARRLAELNAPRRRGWLP